MSRRVAALGLAALLLLAQALALDHGVRHGLLVPGHDSGAVHSQAQHQGSDHAEHADHEGHEPGSATCRLLDQVVQDQLLAATPAALPALQAQAAPRPAAPQGHLAAAARHFQARAPPRG